MKKNGHRFAIAISVMCMMACGACAPRTQSAKWFVPQTFAMRGSAATLTVMGDLREMLPNYRESTTLEDFLYGPADTPAPLLRNAQGIVRVGDTLLVCDQGRPDIVAINFQSGRVTSWIGDSARRPRCPVNITADASGNVFVSDTALKVVLRYDQNGQYLGQFTPSDDFRPGGVVVRDGVLYVGDLAGHTICRWNLVESQWLTPLIPTGTREKLVAPTGLAVTSDGTLLIADAITGVLHRMTPDGASLPPIGKRGRGDGAFVRPKQVCVMRSGLICVTDAGRQSVLVFDASGVFLTELHERADAWGGLTLPTGIATLGDGGLFDLSCNPNFARQAGAGDWFVVSDSLATPSLVVVAVNEEVGGAGAGRLEGSRTGDARGAQ